MRLCVILTNKTKLFNCDGAKPDKAGSSDTTAFMYRGLNM